MTVSRRELRQAASMQPGDSLPPAKSHPSRADLLTVRQAVHNKWPMTPEAWERSAREALGVVLDPETPGWWKLAALMVFTAAAKDKRLDVDGMLAKLLAESDCQNGTNEPEPPNEGCS